MHDVKNGSCTKKKRIMSRMILWLIYILLSIILLYIHVFDDRKRNRQLITIKYKKYNFTLYLLASFASSLISCFTSLTIIFFNLIYFFFTLTFWFISFLIDNINLNMLLRGFPILHIANHRTKSSEASNWGLGESLSSSNILFHKTD